MTVYKQHKQLIAGLVILLAGIAGCNAPEQADKPTVITGTLVNFHQEDLRFSYQDYSPLSGLHDTVAAIRNDSTFKLVLHIDAPIRGFFSCGKVPARENFTITKPDGGDSAISVSTFDPRLVYVYLQPGDEIHIRVDADSIQKTLSFSGSRVNDNLFMNKEDDRFNSYKQKFLNNLYTIVAYSPDEYLRYIDNRKADEMKFLEQFDKEHQLSAHLKKVFYWDFYGGAVSSKIAYPVIREGYLDKKVTLPGDYFSFINQVKPADQSDDLGVSYFYFLDAFLRKKYELSKSGEDYYKYVRTQLEGRPLYDYYAFSLRKDFNKELYGNFGKDCPYPDLASRVREKYHHLEGMLEGNPAPDIKFINTGGQAEKLSQYRGKYVYIDCWATWCGPCIKELPDLKKLQQEYHNRNITFISISFDDAASVDKWKTFVKEHNLTGVQVRLDDQDKKIFSRAFNIKQIPRFILLDPQGNIISANAPRPSSKSVRGLLDSTLEES